MSNQFSLLDKNFESMTFENQPVKCIFCDHEFDLSFKLNQNKEKLDQLRKHLVVEHQFIISDINDIDDLNGYLYYWRNRIFKIPDLKLICAVIKTNSGPEDKDESMDYYMLCPDVLPEDQTLREELKLAKLNYLIKIQEIERNDKNFERSCLFCRKIITGNRTELFTHLNETHNLKLGNPNNIVFVKEFLDLIEKKLNSKICLYCEGSFKDWHILKEHMRKKMHKHLNPHSKEYDEFYLINYLKTNTKWYKFKKVEESDDEREGEDSLFNDWVETENESLNCLFCPENFSNNLDQFKDHLLKMHLFDFSNLDQYSYYKKVQIINYIRSKVKELECMNCNRVFISNDMLNYHLINENHNQLPLKVLWNSPKFYQPVIENDLLLRIIDDVDNDLNDELESKLIIPE